MSRSQVQVQAHAESQVQAPADLKQPLFKIDWPKNLDPTKTRARPRYQSGSERKCDDCGKTLSLGAAAQSYLYMDHLGEARQGWVCDKPEHCM